MKKTYLEHHKEIEAMLKTSRGAFPEFISMREAYEKAKEELLTPPPSIKISGWPLFNEITGGFRPREFSILCGPTGSGKTTWLANLSAQLIANGVTHFVASVETGATDFLMRVMSAIHAVDYNTGEEFEKSVVDNFDEGMGHLMKSDRLYLARYNTKVNPSQMLCDIKACHENYDARVAILDNLNFFLPFSDQKESLAAMDKVIHNFIVFCKHVDIHVIMVMHPRKTDNGRVDSEFDIKGSSTAVQEAHNVFLFNRPSEEDARAGFDRKIYRDLKVAKLRRRGKHVGKRVMYRNFNSNYEEAELL